MVLEIWEEKKFGEIAQIIDCKHRTPIYVDDGIPVISPGIISWGALNTENAIKQVSRADYESLMDHCTVDVGDIVLSRNQSVGIASFVSTDDPFVLGQDTILVKPKHSDSKFIFYVLQSRDIQKQIERLSGGSTFSRINLKDIRQLKFTLPNLDEQKEIANILSTWDKAIETVEKLITNSQNQKKALIQKVVSGKTRFSIFDDKWSTYKLSKLGKFLRGSDLSKEKLSDGGRYSCILYGELYTRYLEVIDTVISRTDCEEGLLSLCGDVLIPSSTTTSGIDLVNVTSLKIDGVRLGGDIIVFRVNQTIVNSDFIAYALTHLKKKEIASVTQGITIIHLYAKDLLNIEISLPAISEQNKIVEILANVQQGIFSLESKLTYLKQEKQALMQQLLTGKRRVNIDKELAS